MIAVPRKMVFADVTTVGSDTSTLQAFDPGSVDVE
jgi:hypothetical protein